MERRVAQRTIAWPPSLVVLVTAILVSATIAGAAPCWAASSGVFAWGSNEFGQLGDGTFANSTAPRASAGVSAVLAISGGSHHTLALTSQGSVVAWGGNAQGQLGDGEFEGPEKCYDEHICSTKPVVVRGLSEANAIAAGDLHSLALVHGTVMAWGLNNRGQLGDGTFYGPETCGEPSCSTTPVAVSGLSDVIAISAGTQYSLALLNNGTVMAWGDNGAGQLGNGRPSERSGVPVAVSGLSHVTAIAAGGYHALALLKSGKVMAWGDNEFGELGDRTHNGPEICQFGPKSSYPCATTPVLVQHLSHVVAIAAGQYFSLALLRNGKVMAWGENFAGELGDGRGGTGTNEDRPTLSRSLSGAGVTELAAGAYHALALLKDGTVMAWGENGSGQLGDETETGPERCPHALGYTFCSVQPLAVHGLSGVAGIAAGGAHSLALAEPG